MSRRVQLRKYVQDIASAGVPTLLVKLRGLLLLPFLTRTLGLEGYGAWVQVVASTNLLMLFASLGLHSALIRFHPEEADRRGAGRLLFTLSLLAVSCAAILALPYAWFAPVLSGFLLHTTEWSTAFLAGALLIPLGAARLMLVSHFRAQDRIRWISGAESLFGLVELGLIVAATLSARSVTAIILASVMGLAAYVTGLGAIAWREGFLPSFGTDRLREYLRYAIPLVPTMAADEVINRGDRLIVGAFLGASAVGLYSAIYALASLPMMLGTPIVTALLPKVIDRWTSGDRRAAGAYIGMTVQAVSVVYAGLFVASVIAGNAVLDLLIGAADSFAPTGLLVLAGTSAYAIGRIYSLALFADKSTHRLSVIWMLSGAVSVLLNVLLVPRFGLPGAGAATALTYGGFLVVLILMTRHVTVYPEKWWRRASWPLEQRAPR